MRKAFQKAVMCMALAITLTANAQAAQIIVDYTQAGKAINSRAFGVDVTGYGSGRDITNDSVMMQMMGDLRLGQMRMHLKYKTPGDPHSPIQCGGAGCAKNVPGDVWITKIKAMGAEPVVILQMAPPTSVQDAASMVRHFNLETRNPVKYWIIGNESPLPDAEQITLFNRTYDAMKAADPSIKIGGVGTAYFNEAFLQKLLAGSGNRIDFIDFHQYGEGGEENLPESVLLKNTVGYEEHISALKADIRKIVPARADQIDVQVGEWNMNWNGKGAVNAMFTQFNTVWGASVIGHILRAGGISLQYGDKNGPLGTLYESLHPASGAAAIAAIDQPMPVYYAHVMFTGGKWFRHFGNTLAQVSVDAPDLEVFASDNPKNIVVINKNPTAAEEGIFTLKGTENIRAQVWQKNGQINPLSPPAYLGEGQVHHGRFASTLPPYSVTTFILN
ncbi:MAG TPA: hypothetical protein VFT64_03925 [Rickettsiales bacterium]|nr:hypothetical protein [Rickettsiales bacterium]